MNDTKGAPPHIRFSRSTKGFSEALGFDGNTAFACSIIASPGQQDLLSLNLEFRGRHNCDSFTTVTVVGTNSNHLDRMIQMLTEAREYLKTQEGARRASIPSPE